MKFVNLQYCDFEDGTISMTFEINEKMFSLSFPVKNLRENGQVDWLVDKFNEIIDSYK